MLMLRWTRDSSRASMSEILGFHQLLPICGGRLGTATLCQYPTTHSFAHGSFTHSFISLVSNSLAYSKKNVNSV